MESNYGAVLEIQQNNPVDILLTLIDENIDPEIPVNLTGLIVYISVKKKNDFRIDDIQAIITSKIITHIDPVNGETLWSLTAVQTLQALGIYKADVKVYTNANVYINSSTFDVEIVPIVTHRII